MFASLFALAIVLPTLTSAAPVSAAPVLSSTSAHVAPDAAHWEEMLARATAAGTYSERIMAQMPSL